MNDQSERGIDAPSTTDPDGAIQTVPVGRSNAAPSHGHGASVRVPLRDRRARVVAPWMRLRCRFAPGSRRVRGATKEEARYKNRCEEKMKPLRHQNVETIRNYRSRANSQTDANFPALARPGSP